MLKERTEVAILKQELNIVALDAWLADKFDGYSQLLDIRPLAGAESRETFLLRMRDNELVLRRQPNGTALGSVGSVDREFAVTKAMHQAGIPVARPYLLCEDPAVIGNAFYVMEYVQGRNFRDASLHEVSDDHRAAHFDAMSRTIARIHTIDPRPLGLSEIGGSENDFARQINGWVMQCRNDTGSANHAGMERIFEWLLQNIPNDTERTVVHGDFRCKNIVFHPVEPRVLAVLDWKLSMIGSPVSDFVYHLLVHRLPPFLISSLAGLDLVARNIPTEAQYVEAYCRHTGRTGLSNFNFYLTFNVFRLAVAAHGIKAKIARDGARSDRKAYEAQRFEALLDVAWRSRQAVCE